MHTNMTEVHVRRIFLLPNLSTIKMETMIPTNETIPMMRVE